MNYSFKETEWNNQDFQKLCLKLDDFQNELIPERRGLGLSALDGLDRIQKVFMFYDKKNLLPVRV